MPFVRSAPEVKRLQAILRQPTFSGVRSIATPFITDPGIIERLLPPPLTPTQPIARVWIADIQASNVAGAFTGAGLDIAAAHDGEEGWYCLFMPMSTDTAVQVGRETLGEPKKLCEIRMERQGDTVRGAVARLGATLLTLEVTPDTELGSFEQDDLRFHYKYQLACDGSGYDAPPKLIHARHHFAVTDASTGPATVTLSSTAHDPLAEVPVVEVLQGTYAEGEDTVQARTVCDVPGDAFLPWAYANTDDWLVFAEVQKRVHGLTRAGRA